MPLINSPIAKLVPQAQRRQYLNRADGNVNVVYVVLEKRANADADLGIAGVKTETKIRLLPEPFVNAMHVQAVNRSGGTYRFSDLKMTAARECLTEIMAMSSDTEFEINGDRYEIITAIPSPSAWEFVIRRKTSEPFGS